MATKITIERSPKFSGERIFVRAPYALKDVCKSITGRWWENDHKAWSYPASPSTAREIADAFANAPTTTTPEFDAMLEARDAASLAVDGDPALLAPIPSTIGPRPWTWQVRGYNALLRQPGTLFHWRMGAGKSRGLIDYVVNDPDCNRVLIECPSSVVPVWPREFGKYAQPDAVWVLPLGKGSVADRMQRAAMAYRQAEIQRRKIAIVINYEAAWMGAFGQWAESVDWDLVAGDESHRFARHTTKTCKHLCKVGARARRRLGLSGTPLREGPIDAFGQYLFLDPGVFGTGWQAFKERYAIYDHYGHQIIRYQNLEDFNRRFYSIAIRDELDKEVTLKEPLHIDVPIELSAEARKVYDALEDDMIARDDGRTVVAANTLVKMLRLQQITGGFVPMVDDETEATEVVWLDDSKKKAIVEILDNLPSDEPVVVVCRFRQDLDTIHGAAKAAGRKSLELSGRRKDIGAYWPSGEDTVLAVQIQAGGVGIDLTRAAYNIMLSVGYSLVDYEQVIARTNRPGQTRKVTYYHLVAEGTADRDVYDGIGGKRDLVTFALDRLRERRKGIKPAACGLLGAGVE